MRDEMDKEEFCSLCGRPIPPDGKHECGTDDWRPGVPLPEIMDKILDVERHRP